MIDKIILCVGFLILGVTTNSTKQDYGILSHPNDYTGFEPIFFGNLTNWDGDPRYWRAENNILIGQSDVPITENSFIIWRGGTPKNFELKLDFLIWSGNSGIQYRSEDLGNHVMKGYQADIDYDMVYTGQIYEELGRGYCANRGEISSLLPGGTKQNIGTVGDGEELKRWIKVDDWNQYHIIARDNILIQILNGHAMALVIDDDTVNRAMEGLIGLQMHIEPSMRVEYRNIYLMNVD